VKLLTFTGVPAKPCTSFSSREPRNHGCTSEPSLAAMMAAPTFTAGSWRLML
jgi:hypothetical protein